jgi:hypothetical protein
MSENGEKKTQKILEGIQYLIGDNKHLREELRGELREFARKAEEDRKQAELDRRRSDDRFERMMEKMDEDRTRSDERFATVIDQVKRINRVAVDIARDLRRQQRELLDGNHELWVGQKQMLETQKQMLEGQQQSNRLLGEIVKKLPPGTNGKT